MNSALVKVKQDYQGKLKHYRNYTKELHKALKQNGAILEEPDSTQSNIYIKIKNPKEYFQKLIIHNNLNNYKDYYN